MTRQPELFPRTVSNFRPVEGQKEPRLWVRRLVIWRDMASKPIRDIPLRPGLNVGAYQGGAPIEDVIGHGSGKTLFCRMLRYCLGEPRYDRLLRCDL